LPCLQYTTRAGGDATEYRGRGGAYGHGPDRARTWYQAFEGLEAACNDVGCRCVVSSEPIGR